MKKLLAIVLSVTLLSVTPILAADNDKGHKLKALWEEYHELESKDKPAAKQVILKDIMKQAALNRFELDFYDAAHKYVLAACELNWREYSNACDYVVGYADKADLSIFVKYLIHNDLHFTSLEESLDFLATRKDVLEKSSHREFYHPEGSGRYGGADRFAPFVYDYISNDYEFLLWRTFGRTMNFRSPLLSDYLGSSYPNGKYSEFLRLLYLSDYKGIEAFAKENRTRAVAIYAEEALLGHRLDSIAQLRVASRSDEMAALLAQYKDLQRRRDSFRGSEKVIASFCTQMDDDIRRITEKSAGIAISGDSIKLIVRNLPDVDIRIRRDSASGPILGTAHLDNPVKSCHFPDTLVCRLPDMDDGILYIECSSKDYKESFQMNRSRLSAVRTFSAGKYYFHVCDAASSKPVDRVNALVLSGKDTLKQYVDFQLDKLTPMEVGDIHDRRARVKFSCKDEKGFEKNAWISLGTASRVQDEDRRSCQAMIFTDRAAFNPGDTLKFKVLGFNTLNGNFDSVMGSGTPLKLSFVAADGKLLESQDLVLNGFGSAAGDFVIPYDMRNGTMSLRLMHDDKQVGRSSVTVDDFVLPDFEIIFEGDDQMKFIGDSLTVRGLVKAYSGHKLTDARVSYSIEGNDYKHSGKLELDGDGAFEIPVFTKKSSNYMDYYRVQVRVTDASGTTVEGHNSFALPSAVHLQGKMLDKAVGRVDYQRDDIYPEYLLDEDVAKFLVSATNYRGVALQLPLKYTVRKGKDVISEGKAICGDTVSVNLAGCPSGDYIVSFKPDDASVSAGSPEGEFVCHLFRILPGSSLGFSAERAYLKVDDKERAAMLFGGSDSPLWALAVVTDARTRILDSRMVCLDGGCNLTMIGFDWKEDWPDNVSITVMDVRNGKHSIYTADYQRDSFDDKLLPLSFSTFTDKSLPGQICSLSVMSRPGVECLVSVFDKSTETVRQNSWRRRSVSRPYTRLPFYWSTADYDEAIPFQMVRTKSAGGYVPMTYRNAVANDMVSVEGVVEDAVEEEMISEGDNVRDNFARTLCFEPFAVTDAEGRANVSFKTSDVLSTFVVSVFAHDKSMANNVLRREMLVTLPLKISVGKPQYLYEGDRFKLAVSIQNSSDMSMDGTLYCYVYQGNSYKDAVPVRTMSHALKVGAGESVADGFLLDMDGESDVLGFKLVYDAGQWSDAVFVTVPVKKARQTLTEAHSMVFRPGMDEEDALRRLQNAFTGTSPYGASYCVRSLDDILADFTIGVEPASSPDVVSWAGVLYKALYAGRSELALTAMSKIAGCRNADGGFGWIPGMKSSVMLTESIVLRMIRICDNDLWDKELYADFGAVLDDALKYLDKEAAHAYTKGELEGRSLLNYLFVRSLAGKTSPWTGLSFGSIPLMSEKGAGKAISVVLTDPQLTRANVVAKFKRTRILLAVIGDERGLGRELKLSSWGIQKMRKMLCAEIESVMDYAVRSEDGSASYPSALIVYRDLMSSEAFLHVFAAEFFSRFLDQATMDSKLAKLCGKTMISDASSLYDGLMLRILLQKESQKWSDDPYYVEAVFTLLNSSVKIKNTKVVSLSKAYSKPFGEIKPSSNGMNLSVRYMRCQPDGSWTELNDGEHLTVGDKLKAVYSVHSDLTRSFVRLAVPRPACFRPAEQLSGWAGFAGGGIARLRGCYREVRSDMTCYWFDTLAEGKFQIEELIDMTADGTFIAPAATLVCDYAPVYRANTASYMF